jgi:MFS family permease
MLPGTNVSTHSSASTPRIFYGWFVVAGTFAVTFVGFGSAYSFSAFLLPLQRDFAASRGSIALVFSIAGFFYFALGVISGPLADRFGSRLLAVIGMVLTGAGLMVASVAQTLLQVYLAYGLGVGLGIGCSYVPAIAAVQRWFLRQRGFASGLAVSGIGVGTLVFPPLAKVMIDAFDWRQTYLILGIVAMVAGAGMAMLIEDDPSRRGLGVDGGPPAAIAPAAVADGAIRTAVTSRRFIGLYAACFICSFGLFVPFVHLVPYALDHGVASSAAVLLIGAIGVGSTAGRFLLGGMADRIGRSLSFLLMFVGMGVSFVIWLFAVSLWPLAVFALVFGVFYGGFVALAPAVVIDYFGARQASSLIGIVYTSVAFGTLIGPSAAGFVFDVSHSYTLPILLSIAVYVVASAILALTSAPAPAR